MSDQERVTIELPREYWDAVKWALVYAVNKRRFERPAIDGAVLGRVAIAHESIAAQLRAQDAGEGE